MNIIASAMGLKGTGLGCFVESSTASYFGLENSNFQILYHFTVGVPTNDLCYLPYSFENNILEDPKD